MDKQVTISLDHDDALVLFEFLARFGETEKLELEDGAEAVSLWHLHSALEKLLVEPLSPDYQALLDGARVRVRDARGVQ